MNEPNLEAVSEIPPVETIPAEITPPAAPPPATKTVLEGESAEDTIQLKKRLEQTESEKRKAEIRAAELENENIELRKIPKVHRQEKPVAAKSWDEEFFGQ